MRQACRGARQAVTEAKENAMPLIMQEPAPRSAEPVPIGDAERAARVQLAACYRLFDLLGWTESIFNHITLRVPGPQRIFLINPFGLQYHEVTASNLVAVDIDGQPVRPSEHPVNRAGFVTHSAIHGHVDGAHCVMHTHTTSGMAVACLEDGMSHDNFYGAQLSGRVAYHEFEGITVNLDERQRMLASIGDKRCVILRNHGLLSWGGDVAEAFMWLWTMQRACDVQIASAAAGRTHALSNAARAQCVREAGPAEPAVCAAVFVAGLRRLDAAGANYAD
jgi:ribulose-5-phosphate 4-epimerase/fuculose-1-phosphate aldolase